MAGPIFHDASGRRGRLVGRASALLLALIVLGAIAFAATVVEVPSQAQLDIGHERQQPLPFLGSLSRITQRLRHPHPPAAAGAPERLAFYVPWDPDSLASLSRHYDHIDTVIAAEALIDTGSGRLSLNPDPAFHALLRERERQPRALLMVQNLVNERWDGEGTARLLARPNGIEALAQQVAGAVRDGGWQGAVFDIEQLPGPALSAYYALLARTRALLARDGRTVAVTVDAGLAPRELRRYAASVDSVILMDYDLHWQGGEPGPIAPQDWFAQQLAVARAAIPRDKLVVAIGSYGYDWHDGTADALTIDEAWQEASDSGAVPIYDAASGNSGFAFADDGHKHMVWMLDAATSWNELGLLGGVKGVALWRLGSEEEGYWEALSAARHGRLPDLTTIAPASGTDVEGQGEVLTIAATPSGGGRQVRFNRQRMVEAESFTKLPTPYVVERGGARDPKAIALTFDDGPDPNYTPQVLAELERAGVPATFFVIGENAVDNPGLLRRMVSDGDEIGNHTYTHPDLSQVPPLGVRLELNATQRLVEAYTGRSTRLFRAPYFGDAEPTTADELGPALEAQRLGYTIVGLHIDPGDWRTPGVEAIVERTVAQIHAATPDRTANIVLLHDAGGRRDQTVAALPILIERLQREGYRFVTVSALAGLSRDAVMPPVTGREKTLVQADVAVFRVLAFVDYLLRLMFFFAIALGIARAVLMTGLAIYDRRTSPAPPALGAEGAGAPRVSVIIPAFNEERVIVASIARVLASDYPDLELIVADDGSKDATGALVTQHYGGDPRVRLLNLANGGKARALNRALGQANGEIVVALDADTQFLPETIARLVRWFADPAVGAVAGNARVGNRVNLVTRWQSVEYVTAQNVERRALDAIGAITVVPGAVGAWRRRALDEVGGYPEDTLAEDQDLTIAIQRRGWQVEYDVEAIALTEAPESFRALGRQRYRWSFGTLQCLWKHRAVLRSGRPRGLAWFGMPQAWLFQIVFAACSPLIDLALLISILGTALRVYQHGWLQTQSDVLRMGLYWLVFVSVDLLAGWFAYRMEPGRPRFPAPLLVAQRFVYRQLMYGVVLRSLRSALQGRVVGWGKLERTGSVAVTSG